MGRQLQGIVPGDRHSHCLRLDRVSQQFHKKWHTNLHSHRSCEFFSSSCRRRKSFSETLEGYVCPTSHRPQNRLKS
jgi:hypothetical protein